MFFSIYDIKKLNYSIRETNTFLQQELLFRSFFEIQEKK